MQDAKNADELNAILDKDNVLLLLSQAGFANELIDKYRACQCIIIHFVFKTRREELQQLRVGYESISLLQFLKMCESCDVRLSISKRS